MSFLCCLPPKEFAIVANLIGVALSEDLTVDEQNALGNLLIAVGQALVTVATQTELCQPNKD